VDQDQAPAPDLLEEQATAAENTLHSLPEPVEETTPSFLPRS